MKILLVNFSIRKLGVSVLFFEREDLKSCYSFSVSLHFMQDQTQYENPLHGDHLQRQDLQRYEIFYFQFTEGQLVKQVNYSCRLFRCVISSHTIESLVIVIQYDHCIFFFPVMFVVGDDDDVHLYGYACWCTQTIFHQREEQPFTMPGFSAMSLGASFGFKERGREISH